MSRHETPVAAATAGIPPHAIRILAVREQGDDAYVLFDGRPEGPSYPYGVFCKRDSKGWHERGSSNMGGWSSTSGADGVEDGAFVLWGALPRAVTHVRVEHKGVAREEPVENGWYLSAWWNEPTADGPWPSVRAYRTDDVWRESLGRES